jgi:hypothetical protein
VRAENNSSPKLIAENGAGFGRLDKGESGARERPGGLGKGAELGAGRGRGARGKHAHGWADRSGARARALGIIANIEGAILQAGVRTAAKPPIQEIKQSFVPRMLGVPVVHAFFLSVRCTNGVSAR